MKCKEDLGSAKLVVRKGTIRNVIYLSIVLFYKNVIVTGDCWPVCFYGMSDQSSGHQYHQTNIQHYNTW